MPLLSIRPEEVIDEVAQHLSAQLVSRVAAIIVTEHNTPIPVAQLSAIAAITTYFRMVGMSIARDNGINFEFVSVPDGQEPPPEFTKDDEDPDEPTRH